MEPSLGLSNPSLPALCLLSGGTESRGPPGLRAKVQTKQPALGKILGFVSFKILIKRAINFALFIVPR